MDQSAQCNPEMTPEELSYGIDVTGLDPASLTDALRAVIADVMMDPMRMSTWLTGFALAEQNVGLNMLRRLSGEPATQGFGDDKRFAEPEWSLNPILAGLVEDYRARTQAALQLVDSARLPEATRRKARFAMQLMCDAFAPSNVPWLNPGVVKEATESGGMSLVRGLENFLDDVKNNGGYPRQVDKSGFELGKNIAATAGRVVMRNRFIELIAYEPQTPQVHETPLLCSPPWINKYYIMDLAPGRSFVEWAVAHGHQTFMISYRNPDESMAHCTMDDYLREGVLAALDAVQEITGAPRVNVVGLCLGGTLALIAMAYLAAHGQGDRIASATLTNTLVDFSNPGDLGVFTDEDTIARLEKRMRERGYLEPAEMARTFDESERVITEGLRKKVAGDQEIVGDAHWIRIDRIWEIYGLELRIRWCAFVAVRRVALRPGAIVARNLAELIDPGDPVGVAPWFIDRLEIKRIRSRRRLCCSVRDDTRLGRRRQRACRRHWHGAGTGNKTHGYDRDRDGRCRQGRA